MGKFTIIQEDDSAPAAATPGTKRGTFTIIESPNATQDQKSLASGPMRFLKGLKDPIDAGAQLLSHAVPQGAIDTINEYGGKIGLPKFLSAAEMDADIKNSDAQMQAARQATGQDGMDVARLAGNVLSPVNAGLGAALPVMRGTTAALAAKGALAGAAGAAAQPVIDNQGDFSTEKLKQAALGAAAGGVLTPVLSKAADSIARMAGQFKEAGKRTVQDVANTVKETLAKDNVNIEDIPAGVLAKLTDEVNQAIKGGKNVDSAALLRQIEGKQQGVELTLGQATRNPTQYTKEVNLRGIQGAGEPLANRFSEQAGIISRKLDVRGPSSYEAGQELIQKLKDTKGAMDKETRGAYKAFKDATGKELEVPLKGLAHDYAATLRDYPDVIPAGVKNRFEELGLLSGTTKKILTIDDAESAIKLMNNHYNPMNKPANTAMGILKGHLEKAISEVSGEGVTAAGLAKTARETAMKGFRAVDASPAFKAAVNAAEPDDFVKKYVINGKVREIEELAKYTGQRTIATQTMRYLQSKALGSNAAGDGAVSQGAFNSALASIGKEKLTAMLGKEKADDVMQLGRVMAYIGQRPAGSAVNESNTASAVGNLLSKVGKAPYINDFVVKPLQSLRERGAVSNALSSKLPTKPSEINPEVKRLLAKIFTPAAIGAGIVAGK